jgi:predicted nucleic acid-binding protein
MMQRYFIDTFYLIALSNARDQGHPRALAFAQSRDDFHLYTVDEVLGEYLTFFSTGRPHIREEAANTVMMIMADPDITIIPQSRASFLAGLQFYAARLDKHYSYADCVSMVTMRRESLTEVLTNDHHFAQEGFRILFP